MATSATRRILHIDTMNLSGVSNEQIGFETSGDLSYFQTANGFWGGKNKFGNISRFTSYNDIVKYPKLYCNDAIVLLPGGNYQGSANGGDSPYLTDDTGEARLPCSINIGGRAGAGAVEYSASGSNRIINIGTDSGYHSSASGRSPINLGERCGYTSITSEGTINIGTYAFSEGIDGYVVEPSYVPLDSNVVGSSINIGYGCGFRSTVQTNVAIGLRANDDGIAKDSIIMGREANADGYAVGCVILGAGAGGEALSAMNSVSIGYLAGAGSSTSYNNHAINVGTYAGWGAISSGSVMVGYLAGQQSNANNAVCVGRESGANAINKGSVSVGHQASNGATSALDSVMIGRGNSSFADNIDNSISIGAWASENNASLMNSICLGDHTLASTIANNTIAIGNYAGTTSGVTSLSAVDCVLLGTSAGYNKTLDGVVIITNGKHDIVSGSFKTKRLGIRDIMNLNPISSAAVTSAAKGDFIFDTNTNKALCYDGTVWRGLW